MKFPNKKYNIIYADPPWTYQDKRTKPGPLGHMAGGAQPHYPTMTIKDIAAIPVHDIADDPCLLFMWVTWPLMPKWNEVITGWGFKYKTLAFEWIKTAKSGKPRIGAGSYTRSNCEPLLLAVRGKAASLIERHNIVNVVMHQRTVHSVKPAVFRDLIVDLAGDLPRIELFARSSAAGWDVWGNETDKQEPEPDSSLLEF